MNRRKIAEWWEVWLCPPGRERVRMMSGWRCHEAAPSGQAYSSREEAQADAERSRNIYARIVHVVRYASHRTSQAGEKP